MDNLIWKIKNFLRSLIPLVVIGGVAFGGWHLYKTGAFRNGVKPFAANVVGKIPYFGSRFSHYIGASRSSSQVAKSKGRHLVSKKKFHKSKKRHARRHRR